MPASLFWKTRRRGHRCKNHQPRGHESVSSVDSFVYIAHMKTENIKNPPVVEAVLDIDCDMPVNFSLEDNIPNICELYKDRYPKARKKHIQQHEIKREVGGETQVSTPAIKVQAVQLVQKDERQLIQVRSQGYSFNRLAPYSRLDDYLDEIQRTWELFQTEFKPIQVKQIRLRFINRIFLPLDDKGFLDSDDYLKRGPRLPDDQRMEFTDFLNQHHVVEKETGNHAKIILATQPSIKTHLPLVFDIETFKQTSFEPEWDNISNVITSLRSLKNHIFSNTLTDKCIDLFQQA